MPKFHVTYTVIRERMYSFTVSAEESDSAAEKAEVTIEKARMKGTYHGNFDSEKTDIIDIEVEEL